MVIGYDEQKAGLTCSIKNKHEVWLYIELMQHIICNYSIVYYNQGHSQNRMQIKLPSMGCIIARTKQPRGYVKKVLISEGIWTLFDPTAIRSK
jgi:hypothetical protein